MSNDLRTRISAVSTAHSRCIDPNHPRYGDCRCGFTVEDADDYHEHLADAVIRELGLRSETRLYSGDLLPGGGYEGRRRRRYVTAWKDDTPR
jgi:hypothetical protein